MMYGDDPEYYEEGFTDSLFLVAACLWETARSTKERLQLLFIGLVYGAALIFIVFGVITLLLGWLGGA